MTPITQTKPMDQPETKPVKAPVLPFPQAASVEELAKTIPHCALVRWGLAAA